MGIRDHDACVEAAGVKGLGGRRMQRYPLVRTRAI